MSISEPSYSPSANEGVDNLAEAIFSNIAAQIRQVAIDRTCAEFGADAVRLDKCLPDYISNKQVHADAGAFRVVLQTEWNPGASRLEEIRALLQEQTELPVSLIWNDVEYEVAKEQRVSRQVQGARRGSTSYDKFNRFVREELPDGVELVKATIHNAPVGRRGFHFATVKVHCESGQEEDLRSWADILEEKAGVAVFAEHVAVNGELKASYRSIADIDGLVRSAEGVEGLRRNLHGMLLPRGDRCRGVPQTPGNVVDLCHEPTVGIDPYGARNIDDLIHRPKFKSDGSVECKVSFVNGSWMVRPGSELYQYARRAGSTIFGRNSSLPMLGDLAYNELSFLEGESRFAFTVQWDLQPDGTRTNKQVYHSRVTNHFQLDYDHVDQMLENGCDVTDGVLGQLAGPVNQLRSHRLGNGNGSGSMLSKSDLIVSEYMIAAYRTAAEFCLTHKIPILYRVHQLPGRSQRQRLLREAKSKGITARMSRELTRPMDFRRMLDELADKNELALQHEFRDLYCTRSRWAANRCGHIGLGIGPYTTLKARKEVGLIVQGQLERYLNGNTPLSQRTIERFQGGVNRNYRKLDSKTYQHVHYERTEHMLSRKGSDLPGTVIAVDSMRSLVNLWGEYCRPALLIPSHSGRPPVPGHRGAFRIEGYSYEADRMVVRPVS